MSFSFVSWIFSSPISPCIAPPGPQASPVVVPGAALRSKSPSSYERS